MLDLETACSGRKTSRPAIIEIAAVQFDLHNGHICEEFRQNVNLKSCVDLGLAADKDPDTMTALERTADERIDNTILWLKKHIPDTYLNSLSLETSSPLPFVLRRFADWVNRLTKASPKPFAMLWGKPSNYDNIWLSGAYAACNLKRPWNGNICCFTVIQTCFLKTGVLFSDQWPGKETFEGVKHHALDDCKHQVKMLIKAANFQTPSNIYPEAVASIRNTPTALPVSSGEEIRLSASGINVLNSLIGSAHIRAGSSAHILKAARLNAPSTLQDIETSLQTVANLIEQPPQLHELHAEKHNPVAQSKRRKLSGGREYDHQPGGDPSRANASIALVSNDHLSTTEPNSPHYGDDSDLDQFFNSFSEN